MTLRERFEREECVTVEEYARKWRVSERTVYTWIDKGAIPVQRIGRSLRILLTETPRGTATSVTTRK